MANTITAVLPSIYAGLYQASREIIGAIPLIQRDARTDRVAVGQSVTVPIVPAATGGNVTPGSVPPDDGDVVLGSTTVSITKSKYSPVRWNGEEQLAIGPTGQYNSILAQQFAEAFRWLANQVEVDIMTELYLSASRAYGTAGTTPFGTSGDLTDFAGVNRILDENGAPLSGRALVVGSGARFNLEGKQEILLKANEAGTDGLLRARIMEPVLGFNIGFSHGTVVHTKGDGTGYLINNGAGEAIGQTTISLDTGGAGSTVKAGDVVTFAGDTNKYVVGTGLDAVSGDIVLNDPGLRIAAADGVAMTIGNTYTANVAFTPDAAILAARAPAAPEGGDSAEDSEMVIDPVSGIAFEVRLYREYRRVRYEVALAWGVDAINESHIATLLG